MQRHALHHLVHRRQLDPGRAPVRRLRIGDPVSVSLDGTNEVYEGRLRWISNEPAFTPYYALNQAQRSRLVYLAKVALHAEAAGLPIGVPVTATLP